MSLIPAHTGHLSLESGGLQIALCLQIQMPMALGFSARPLPHPERPPGCWWPTGYSKRGGPRNSLSFNCSIGTESSGLGLRGIPRPLVPKSPRAVQQAGGWGWGALGWRWLSPKVEARRRGCSGPHAPPPPRAGPCPWAHPSNGCPACSRPSCCPWSPACVYFTRGHALGRVDQERAGKDGFAGRPPRPWLQTQGEHGAQALP